MAEVKKCANCGEVKSLAEFDIWMKSGKLKPYSYCKECKKIKDSFYSRSKELKAKSNRKYNASVKRQVFLYYSNGKMCCKCCGENHYKFLTLDHINNDGAQDKKKFKTTTVMFRNLIENNFPVGYRVLCFNCNCGRYHNGGICPHEEEREILKQNKEKQYAMPLFDDWLSINVG